MAIKIKSLDKTYDKYEVLKNLNLHIKEGEIFGLLGPNGAGKTTLVSILNYLEKKDSGEIKIFGKSYEENKNYIQSISSYVPQSYAFYPDLTAYENLEFFAALYKINSSLMQEKINSCIKMTALENYKNKQAKTFSGGLKRRLNIAIGLLNDPKILYLDEPTVGIDPQSRKYILDIIQNINKEKKTTIIYTSHYMDEIEYLCHEIAILDKGHIVKKDSKLNLINENSNVVINCQDEQISINTQNGYDELLDVFEKIKKDKKRISSINYGNKSLEEMFLKITKQDLRD
ncbi:ABC transporter ATP-binding protein [Poseidonibacter lekithochrous]|uniref:ABC transporter ATP-binding protein n=1 Tax=Poseidonibacter TaxID=2321187 RepID=UPI001C0A3D5E|nr:MULTISPECIES: ABC transporter ATP-binding protein [Poseidonibacter]MBU3014477.1 ABC transporter ATP-binding protein [Poseidonibacter lekithochrous]MDO6827775.1 ABC transporter ATP-binding protein [Poseidonibacter sp. 1_MG-2023]